MKKHNNSDFETVGMVEIAKKAIAKALLLHKAMGNEIVYWKDGKIVREKPVDDSALQNYDKSHKLMNK